MAGYYEGWAPYVPVDQRRRNAVRTVQALRKAGQPVEPVTVEGRTIATTFWGKAWCDNMEGYRDYESRLPRGRSYVRNGSVIDLQVAPGKIMALVSGSELYRVTIGVAEVAKAKWRSICADCSGGIDSLVELLQGRFSKGVMERLCRQDAGLFPKPSEIRFSCSCPDFASMCKHVAAALYGVGARLDRKPELLFRLRAVRETDLVARIDTALPMVKKGVGAGKVLVADDVSALFGIDIAAAMPGKPKPRRTAASAPCRVPAVGKATAGKLSPRGRPPAVPVAARASGPVGRPASGAGRTTASKNTKV